MKSLLITLASVVLTTGVVMNAYNQKKQFYPSVVYITKSSPSMAVLYLQAFVMVILMGKFMRKIFFGQLRPAEMEHLIERSWYAVTETCLAFTVFRDDFSPRFVALFTMLLFLKCFHWLAEDRIDYMERSPVISFLFHMRAIALLLVLSFLDGYFVNHAYDNTLIKGPSVQLVFGFEYAILFTVVVHIFVKYVLHAIDLHNDNPWENKAVYLLYAELLLGFVKVILYLMFLAIMIKVHTFPLFVIRPMYLTVREFKKALNDVVMSRRAIHNMNTLYPDATPEELASGDNVCIICREEMHGSAKKLPCNHIFHTSCLRSWFQRQQTCPTCRMDVFRSTRPNVQPSPPQPQQPQQPGAFPLPPMWQPPAQLPTYSQGHPSIYPGSGSTPGSSPLYATASGGGSAFPPFMASPFYMPFGVPPPAVSDLTGLSVEELRNLEGEERRNVEARIQCLQDIQTLLNAAMLQIQQYTISVNNISRIPLNLPGATSASSNLMSSSGEATSDNPSLVQPAATEPSSTLLPNENSQDGTGNKTEITREELVDNSENIEEVTELHEIRKRRVDRFSSSETETNKD